MNKKRRKVWRIALKVQQALREEKTELAHRSATRLSRILNNRKPFSNTSFESSIGNVRVL